MRYFIVFLLAFLSGTLALARARGLALDFGGRRALKSGHEAQRPLSGNFARAE